MDVSSIELSDEALGLLGARPGLRHHIRVLSWVVDLGPDSRLVSGAVPIPPGSVSSDLEAKQLWETWLECSLHHLRARTASR